MACTRLAVTAHIVAVVLASTFIESPPSIEPDLNQLPKLLGHMTNGQDALLQCRAWCACEALLHLCQAAHVPLTEGVCLGAVSLLDENMCAYDHCSQMKLVDTALGSFKSSQGSLKLTNVVWGFQIIWDLTSAVETTLEHAMKLSMLPPCMLPCFSVAKVLCTLQDRFLPKIVMQAAEACQRQSQVCTCMYSCRIAWCMTWPIAHMRII